MNSVSVWSTVLLSVLLACSRAPSDVDITNELDAALSRAPFEYEFRPTVLARARCVCFFDDEAVAQNADERFACGVYVDRSPVSVPQGWAVAVFDSGDQVEIQSFRRTPASSSITTLYEGCHLFPSVKVRRTFSADGEALGHQLEYPAVPDRDED